MSVKDAGKYTCIADNGLGRHGEKDIYLDVLYPPTVTLESKTYEAEEGGTVEINCQVSSNPEPASVQWTMEGNPEFRQNGNTLLLKDVDAEAAGTYVCRAVNIMSMSDGKYVERASSAPVAVLVRHKPGRAHILPEDPKVKEDTLVTLTCDAKPPGWPTPQYRWYYVSDNNTKLDNSTYKTGKIYTIPKVRVSNEGVYSCQAFNELGYGEMSSVELKVVQPPRFVMKLPTHMTKVSGDQDFSMTCGAVSKPLPVIKWYKNKTEIEPNSDLYEIKNNVTETSNSVYNVQTTLRFYGKARPKTNDLVPEDRGLYMCLFQNEVTKADSLIHLRIERKYNAIYSGFRPSFCM